MKELEILCKVLEREKEVWKKVKPNFEESLIDTYFNFPKIVLRVRETATGQILTYKENVFKNKKWSYANEYETGVGKGIYEILKHLGYKKTVKIIMTKYHCENGIEIQKVKGLGLFLEVEGKNRKEIWERIKKTGIKVSEELGVGKPELALRRNR